MGNDWPALEVDSWTDTRETLHMWLQIVGKIEMVSTPLINHWWNVTYTVSPRGLRTRLMHQGSQGFDAEFDFLDHQLVLRSTAGTSGTVELKPRTVADFYAAAMDALQALQLECVIVPSPNEVAPAVPFAEDTEHKSYDPDAVHTWWRQLLAANRVFEEWRAGFAGKDSPVQLFWGSMDLSCVRYSGRGAPRHEGAGPPACPPWVMAEAESRENASAGFWSGGSAEGSFYAYTYPVPKGYAEGKVSVGSYDESMGEWILPYAEVRQSEDPERTLLAFLNETYALAADLADWDRKLLEVDPHRLDAEIYRRR
ncbi:hypothetical protein B0O41_3873 [Propionibacteriaceae bacterium ES.041]|uniref:DUF5996 family protein n=1 Tax=Enemella evansiae TaxID=2016499 RepID=UPI000B97915A|nr:DUF5996 family protein [Enemella evansiae]OYN96880.1 hypothetical protein CGZ96_11335 [Enemella evansiae]PFG69023.1 hypothetical protein B0O41_3873 [Propionibacteriaceae bacterium ES.041]